MLFKILLLSCLTFSAIYPLSFWISHNDPLKNNFHRFHLGVSCFVLGLAAIIIYGSEFSGTIKNYFYLWSAALFLLSAYYWKKETPHPLPLSFVSLLGIYAILRMLDGWIPVNGLIVIAVLLGAANFCAALFAMNLGHWYLNVHGLPLSHLRRAVYAFWILSALRAIFDLYVFLTFRINLHGDTYALWQFILTIDGFLVILGVLFATLFPLGTLYFVKGTLDVKSTQSATGILYAILCGVVIGELTTKFYLFKYGIPL